MSSNTKIEWADHTFNPWIGCTKVSPGCDHCYAKAEWEDRRHRVVWGAGQRRSLTQTWGDPVRWNKQHDAFYAQHGRRQRVFCASLADVFDNEVPPEWRQDLFELIAGTPNLDWLLLTKRIGNAAAMLETAFRAIHAGREGWADNVPPHIWIGATICNQEEADRDIPKLLAVPAAKRFLSMEPLLGPVDLTELQAPGAERVWLDALQGRAAPLGGSQPGYDVPKLDWVIVGGESGHGARPMHPDWARSLRDQCQAAGVPFLFKQWGEWAPADPIPGVRFGDEIRSGNVLHLHAPGNPEGYFRRGDAHVRRVGKKAAGRLLDGRTWDEVPA